MSNKEIHPTMRRIYDETGLNANSLATLLNVESQKVYNWDKRGISKHGCLQVSEKLNLDYKWILTGEGKPKFESTPTNTQRSETNVGGWIPVKAYTRMGYDGFYTEMGYLGGAGDGYVPSATAGLNAYAVKGTGDSMHPAIRNGWYVICDPDATPTPTEYVEVRLKDGRRTIKEFIGIVDGLVHLLAVNGQTRTTFELEDIEMIVAVTDIVPPSRRVHDYPIVPMQDIYHD